jgi:hypothetical protein
MADEGWQDLEDLVADLVTDVAPLADDDAGLLDLETEGWLDLTAVEPVKETGSVKGMGAVKAWPTTIV